MKKEKEGDQLGQLFVSYKIDTERSHNIDFDEIILGEKIGRGLSF